MDTETEMFSLLADPAHYEPDTWDLTPDPEGLSYWLDHTVMVFEAVLQAARQSLVTDGARLEQAIDEARTLLNHSLEDLKSNLKDHAPVTIFYLDRLTRRILTKCGLQDPFLKIKHEENVKACAHYPRLTKAHDKLHLESQIRVLTEGILAGNVFDLGAKATLHRYSKESPDFYYTLDGLPAHPWLVDDYEEWKEFLLSPRQPLRRVLFFVDNAGPDFVLGCLPLVRILGKRGATVVLAANDQPHFNDMTVPECRAVMKALAEEDPVLRFLLQSRRIHLVGTGSKYCLLDFRRISKLCNEEAAGTDLIILEGMGRAIESNWHARFTCPTLKIAMLKDEWEAKKLGGKLYDLVCKFEMPR